MDETSKHLLTINTHRGLYRYNRLPFGVKSSPGIFQQIMNTMLGDLTGVVSYLDDVIVVAKSEEEHRTHLNNTLQRIKDWGFHLRYEKCAFFLTEVHYLGFIIDSQGRRPDPGKTTAMTEMPVPNNTTMVRAFL